jgi:hypothetical protein
MGELVHLLGTAFGHGAFVSGYNSPNGYRQVALGGGNQDL